MDREDRESERRSDAVGAEQSLEAGALVAGGEAVERLGVLALMVMHPDEHLVAGIADGHRCGRRHADPIADTRDLDDDLARSPVEQSAAQGADHRSRAPAADPAASAMRLRIGAWAR